jgi:hypothetical protein
MNADRVSQFLMNHAQERLDNIVQIRRLLTELEHQGLWKSANISDQGAIEGTKDEILRILNLVETELERAGLWDRRIDADEASDGEQFQGLPTVSLEHVGRNAQEALRCIHPRPS